MPRFYCSGLPRTYQRCFCPKDATIYPFDLCTSLFTLCFAFWHHKGAIAMSIPIVPDVVNEAWVQKKIRVTGGSFCFGGCFLGCFLLLFVASRTRLAPGIFVQFSCNTDQQLLSISDRPRLELVSARAIKKKRRRHLLLDDSCYDTFYLTTPVT